MPASGRSSRRTTVTRLRSCTISQHHRATNEHGPPRARSPHHQLIARAHRGPPWHATLIGSPFLLHCSLAKRDRAPGGEHEQCLDLARSAS
ncbi:hypothetical protein FA95DRAFT_1556219 [Auriscalpium vulgare]|uniref:Uncharacterized protein n=1 Tax=Auriscalpium vulgare TaxID=40419 RepID=A0ACB8S1A0_9AGAM|nr:hypothetical protein FA95DRAFT_1556219 [Auriscalpium vulgare]